MMNQQSPQDAMREQLQRRDLEEKKLEQGAQSAFSYQYAESIIQRLKDLDSQPTLKQIDEAIEKERAKAPNPMSAQTIQDLAATKEAETKKLADNYLTAYKEYIEKLHDQLQKATEAAAEADKMSPIPGFRSKGKLKDKLRNALKDLDDLNPEQEGYKNEAGKKKRQERLDEIFSLFDDTQQTQLLAQKRDKAIGDIYFGRAGVYSNKGFWGLGFKPNIIMTVGPDGTFVLQTNMLQTNDLKAIRDRMRDELNNSIQGGVEFGDDFIPRYKGGKNKDKPLEPDHYDQFIESWQAEIKNSKEGKKFANTEEISTQFDVAKANYRHNYKNEPENGPGVLTADVASGSSPRSVRTADPDEQAPTT